MKICIQFLHFLLLCCALTFLWQYSNFVFGFFFLFFALGLIARSMGFKSSFNLIFLLCSFYRDFIFSWTYTVSETIEPANLHDTASFQSTLAATTTTSTTRTTSTNSSSHNNSNNTTTTTTTIIDNNNNHQQSHHLSATTVAPDSRLLHPPDASSTIDSKSSVDAAVTETTSTVTSRSISIKPDPDPDQPALPPDPTTSLAIIVDRPWSTLSCRSTSSSHHNSLSDEMISPLEYHQSPTGGAGGLGYSTSAGAGSGAASSFSSAAAAAAAAAAVAAANQTLVSGNGCGSLFSPSSLLGQAAATHNHHHHHQAVVALVGAGAQTHHPHQQPTNQLLLYGNDAPDVKEGMDELCPVCGDKVRPFSHFCFLFFFFGGLWILL